MQKKRVPRKNKDCCSRRTRANHRVMCNVDQVDWKPTDAISRPFGVLMEHSGATGTRNKRDWMEGIISTGGRGFVLLAANATLSLNFFCCILSHLHSTAMSGVWPRNKNKIRSHIVYLFCFAGTIFIFDSAVGMRRWTWSQSSAESFKCTTEHRPRQLVSSFTHETRTSSSNPPRKFHRQSWYVCTCWFRGRRLSNQLIILADSTKRNFFRRPSVIHQRSEFLPLAAARRWSSAAVWQLLMKLNGRTHTFYLLRKSCSAFAGCRVVCGEERINHPSSSSSSRSNQQKNSTKKRWGEVSRIKKDEGFSLSSSIFSQQRNSTHESTKKSGAHEIRRRRRAATKKN